MQVLVAWKMKNNILWLQTFTKNNSESHQNFTGSYDKSAEVLDELQVHRILRGRTINKLQRKLFDQH